MMVRLSSEHSYPPLEGRVGERSEPGWGEVLSMDHPTPTALAPLKRSTLPLQGRVSKTEELSP